MANHVYRQSVRDTSAPSDESARGIAATLEVASRYIALLAAWIAMCGSLFFSEVLGWQPCIMCWYQRILMYPLALIITVGILRRDSGLHQYVLPFSILGACTSLYHYLLVKTTWLPPPPCNASVPCTVDYLNWFGFINIPFLALTAFLIITAMMVVSTRHPFDEDVIEDDADVEEPAGQSSAVFRASDVAVLGIIAVVILAFVVGSRLV